MSLKYTTYFGHVQKIKLCFCLRPFSVFTCRKFRSNYYVRFQIYPGLYSILFLGSADIRGYWRILALGHFSRFLGAINCTSQVCTPYHILEMDSLPIQGFQFWHSKKPCKSKQYLAIFRDLEMTQFWPVNCICLACKLSLILGACKILANIYDSHCIWNFIFWYFLVIVETCFLTKKSSKSYTYIFFLSKKQQNQN